jgi:hypothetical protein
VLVGVGHTQGDIRCRKLAAMELTLFRRDCLSRMKRAAISPDLRLTRAASSDDNPRGSDQYTVLATRERPFKRSNETVSKLIFNFLDEHLRFHHRSTLLLF